MPEFNPLNTDTHPHTQELLHLTLIGVFFSSFIPFISLRDAKQTVQRSMWLGTFCSFVTAAWNHFPLCVQGGTVHSPKKKKKNLCLQSYSGGQVSTEHNTLFYKFGAIMAWTQLYSFALACYSIIALEP